MTTAVLTPNSRAIAKRVGPRVYRKQILKTGDLNYGNRKLSFTKPYLTELAAAFNDRAYDQVPFLLVDAENRHVSDPERYRGQVQSIELGDDGLYANIELTEDGQQLIAANPNLGVSVRIVEGRETGDGRAWPRAISHVAGTLDPRVTGMKPWESVDLSADPSTDVLDLTDATYTKEHAVADTPTLEEQIAALPEDERAALLAKHVKTEPEPELTAEEQAEVDALIAAMQNDTELEPVALSEQDRAAIDLAHSQAAEALASNNELRRNLAAANWATEKQQLLNAGVPKADLDLAEPVLSLPESAVIDLSDTEKIDASAVIRKLIENRKGTVDLSVLGDAEGDDDKDKPLLDAWEAKYPAKRS